MRVLIALIPIQESVMQDKPQLYKEAAAAVAAFREQVGRRGAYRLVRAPDGVVSMWDLIGREMHRFEMTFAERGRISCRIEDMSPEFAKGVIAYLRVETAKGKGGQGRR